MDLIRDAEPDSQFAAEVPCFFPHPQNEDFPLSPEEGFSPFHPGSCLSPLWATVKMGKVTSLR
jgi:hypothetical protein